MIWATSSRVERAGLIVGFGPLALPVVVAASFFGPFAATAGAEPRPEATAVAATATTTTTTTAPSAAQVARPAQAPCVAGRSRLTAAIRALNGGDMLAADEASLVAGYLMAVCGWTEGLVLAEAAEVGR